MNHRWMTFFILSFLIESKVACWKLSFLGEQQIKNEKPVDKKPDRNNSDLQQPK